MDPKRLRELLALMDRDRESFIERGEFLKAVDLLLCPDPLTLERAVEVMGREPDEKTKRVAWWDDTKFQFYQHTDCTVADAGYLRVKNPTVGVFACLVLAAKQGELE